MKYGFMSAINRWVSHNIVKASATQNVDGEHIGALNRIFGKLYEVHLASRKVKEWNRQLQQRGRCAIACLQHLFVRDRRFGNPRGQVRDAGNCKHM